MEKGFIWSFLGPVCVILAVSSSYRPRPPPPKLNMIFFRLSSTECCCFTDETNQVTLLLNHSIENHIVNKDTLTLSFSVSLQDNGV